MTRAERRKIDRLIRQLILAEDADSWKGGGDPADWPVIEADLERARQKLAAELDKHTDKE